jgi:hypothetical protein
MIRGPHLNPRTLAFNDSPRREDARWLVGDNLPPHRVGVGDIIVVTDGPRTVAYFHAEDIDAVV